MIQPLRFTAQDAAPSLSLFRQHAPLVHCLTNDVVQTFTANVVLACGASPAMVVDREEATQFSVIADALLINVGTLTRERSEAMRAAVASAREAGKPWTLDPVAVGALAFRTTFCQQLLAQHPAAIRGNASEILALTRQPVSGRGVDSQHNSAAAIQAAQQLAQFCGAVVAVTGETDFITDGKRVVAVSGGSALMTRVVGTGCALSAVVAAFCSLPGDRVQHIASACWLMSHAGELAARSAAGPGSFEALFLDEIYRICAEAAL